MKTDLLLSILTLTAAESDVVSKLRKVEEVLRSGVFSARVDVSDMVRSNGRRWFRTTSFIEYHDGPGGVHSLKRIDAQVEYFYQHHIPYKNFFRIADGTCETLAPNNTEGVLFPESSARHSDDVFLGPTGFIASLAGTDRIIENKGVTRSVRGIETLMWNISDGRDIIRIYFAVDSWKENTRAANVSFPLRIEHLINNVLLRSYEIHQVEVLQPDSAEEILPNLLPRFVKEMCVVRSQLTKPELGGAFAMVTRARNSYGTRGTKEWYDSTIGVFRCDRDSVRIEGELRDSVISEISDFHHGLVYRTTMNTCEMVAAGPHSTRLEPGQLCVAPSIVEAFQFPDPSYIGKTVVRGLLADVWQINAGSSSSFSARIYVSSDAVVSVNVPRRESIKLPLRIDFKVADPNNVTNCVVDDWQVDIFDFEPQSADRVENNFNIEDCSAPPTVMEMTLRSELKEQTDDFRIDWTADSMEKLKVALKKALLTYGPMSPLQIPYFRITETSTSSDLRAVFKVLNPPTYLNSFEPREENMARYEEFAEKHVVNIENCASMCIQGNCATFIFCSDYLEDSCYLMESSSEGSWGEPTGDETCDVYDKAASGKFVYHSVEEIERNLKQAIESSDLNLEISFERGTVELRAGDLVKRPLPFNDDDGNRLFQTESKFYYIKPDHRTSLYIEEVHTIGDCYRNCISNDHIACAVFSFCPSGPKCVLSSLNINKGTNPDPHQDEVLVAAPSTCAVYSVSFLSNFRRQEGRLRPSRSAATDKGFSASNCAFKCRQNKYDNLDVCRSFAYCEEQQSCSFFNEHDPAHDNTTSDDDLLCEHYKLRFSADYTVLLKGALALESSVEVFDVSVDECARRCSELSEGVCTSFSHCENGGATSSLTSCSMYTTAFDGTVRNRTDARCTVYIRNENMNDIIRPSRQHFERPVHVNGLANEFFAGLLSGMLALGILTGVVGWNSRVKLGGLLGQGSYTKLRTFRERAVRAENEFQLHSASDHS